ncbi:MAG: hypothetical protein Q8K70_10485 [Bacteroidota bacterium]|nr:hypothetical protein [Bacteroidota bacterium]
MKTRIMISALAVLALFGCEKKEVLNPSNNLSTEARTSATSTHFSADLLSDNEPFNDANLDITGYAWEWKIVRNAGTTALSHFNFIDGILCAADEQAGTLRDHIVGAYYSQDNGTTWTNVTVSWGIDGSTNGICYTGEVFKINFGGDNLLVRLVMDQEYEVGVQYALFKRGKGNKQNASQFPECGIIEFAAPGCPVVDNECWQDETAWATGSRYINPGNWATYTANADLTNGVTIYAGQTIDIGTAKLVNGKIEISLTGGWELQEGDETVKIQGYDAAPSGNPAPGNFTTYKGTSLSPSVDSYNFYGIHLDVRKSKNCVN